MNNKDYIDERIVNAFSAYVSKIIHNSSIDFIRKYRRSQANEILFGYNFNNIVSLSNCSDNGTFYLYDEIDYKDKFQKCLNKLTNREKALVNLLMKDFSLEEISKIMNIDIESVYSLKSKARKKLKEYLEDYDYE